MMLPVPGLQQQALVASECLCSAQGNVLPSGTRRSLYIQLAVAN
jgi:hypothetical protein